MSHEDPTGPSRDPARPPDTQPPQDTRSGIEARAEARRDSLRAILTRLDLTPTELARRAGLPNANIFFNFFNGRSASLSQATQDKILAALPGVTQEELTGRLSIDAPHQASSLWAMSPGKWPVLTCEAEAGVWRRSAKLPPGKWLTVPTPKDLPSPGPAAFAVRLKGAGADRLYPPGTIAVCVPLSELPVRSGCRVLVHCDDGRRHELTLRELVLEEGKAWLWPRSSHPEHQVPIAVPWPLYEPVPTMIGLNEVLLSIEGVVTATWQPEAALGLP